LREEAIALFWVELWKFLESLRDEGRCFFETNPSSGQAVGQTWFQPKIQGD
jgi:hypothetical protein